MTRAQALSALAQLRADARLAGVQRLAEVGSMTDSPRVFERLRDSDAWVRESAVATVWRIWGRSGDPAIGLTSATHADSRSCRRTRWTRRWPRRAVAVNPNLDAAAQTIPLPEQQLA
jgi:hypothetical protein